MYAKNYYGVQVEMKDIDVPSQERFELSLEQYSKRVPIQTAFPYLNADTREFMISGTTPEEWDAMFPKEENK